MDIQGGGRERLCEMKMEHARTMGWFKTGLVGFKLLDNWMDNILEILKKETQRQRWPYIFKERWVL